VGNDSLRGQAARGGAITLATQLIRTVIQLGGMMVLARFIAPQYFGLIAMVLAIAGIAEIFRDFGLSQSALRRTDLTHQQRSNLFWLNTASGLVLALALYGLSWAIAGFYGQAELVTIVQWIAPVYLLGGIATQFRVHINVALRFKALAVIDLVSPLVATGTAIVLAMQGYALTALIAMQVVAPVVLLILSVALARWRPGLPRRTEGMRELLTFGASFAFTQLLSYATRNVDSIAIGRVWGAGPLGIYDRAFQFSVAPLSQINTPMSRVAIPVLARVVRDRPKYIASLREAQLIQTYVTATGLLIAAGLGTPLMVLLLGDAWVTAGVIFSLLALGSVFRSIQQIAYWMYITLGLAGAQLKLYLVGQPLIIACILVGLIWGPVGVAAGSTVGWAIFWLMSLLWIRRVSGIRVRELMLDPLRVLGVVGLPAGGLALAVALWVALDPLWVVLIGAGAALAWIGFVALAVPGVRRDVRTLARFARMAMGR
jgi:PST family polysaccharide transporter